jgi:hypothetical protein
VGSKRILWVKVNPDFKVLFRLMDSFCVDTRQCFWSSEQSIEVNTCDMVEDMGHTVKEVKIALSMSHNTLTSAEEDIK